MRKRHIFRPTPDSLEDRLLLHGGAADSAVPDASPQLSTAADVFQSQTGRILTAAQVFQAHLSRSEIAAIIANQIRGAYSAFKTGLNTAMSDLATSGDGNAFEADVTALCSGLAGRYGEILSTSPRAANSLVPFCLDAINGSGTNSLTTQLTALSIDPSNTSASQSDVLSQVSASLQQMLTSLGTFARRPDFQFTSTGSGGGSPTPTPTPTPPAAPTTLSAGAFSTTRIDMSWTGATGATGYKIERSTNGTDWTQVGTTAAETTKFSDSGLAPSTSFSYRVRATNAGGDSSPSSVATAATPPLNPPDAPADFVLSPISDPHHQGLAMHIHPNVSIIINGQPQTIPTGIGLTYIGVPSQFTAATPIHTHSATGDLHVESTQVFTFHLSDFFNVWSHYAGGQGHPVSDPSIVFNSQNILGHQVDATHTLTMTVNGQPSTAFEKLPLNNPDGTLFSGEGTTSDLKIVIDYEPKSATTG